MGTLPQKLLAWYGDDFTGSTDVLEMLSMHGLGSVLFLEKPDATLLDRFAGYRAFGLAGSSRSRSPEWMDEHLPAAFEWLASLKTPLCHYKVCSTFDSSPDVGNIGRALEIGQRVFQTSCVPIIAGAPALGRYTFFGNLFAAAGDKVYRIDRHPTMSRHPVTPMNEADLRLHLAHQTEKQIALMSFLDLNGALPEADAVLLDVMDAGTLRAAGSIVWNQARQHPLFVVGSSGVEHALAAAWALTPITPRLPASVDRLVVLSGSCSPVTAAQIGHATANGFAAVPLDPRQLAERQQAVIEKAITDAVRHLKEGRSVVLYTAAGPDDHVPAEVASRPGFRESLGQMSGRVLTSVLDQSSVRRVIVAGGDTSSHAGSLLDVQALTFVCPLAPGAPLCRSWSANPARDGIEIVFKGGQCGSADFFIKVKG